jgi:type II secretory ATPase GspE/PulE/Tfp pilus assembly ATPase PilB-like protein
VANKFNNKNFLELLIASTRHLVTGHIQPYLIKSGGANLQFLETLIKEELVSKDSACRLWGDSLGVAYVNPLVSVVTSEAVRLITREIASKALVIGLFQIDDILTVAMAEPQDQVLVKRLESVAGCKISPVFAPPSEINDAIRVYYEEESSVQQELLKWEQAYAEMSGQLDDESFRRMMEETNIPKILDGVLFSAIAQRASDIHLEPRETDARVRYRIDGRLQEIHTCGKAVLRAFLTRCKVLAKLNVAEARLPQDGRFSMPLGMGTADFRYSDIPTQYGNKGVIRILSGIRQNGFRLETLQMLPRVAQPFRRVINSPNGIFLVTGPTGSGKTTTLYAALDALNSPTVNISTIEDPIEIRLPGVTQTQIHTAIGLTFQSMLRSLLRQDPDVLLIGEIRDADTARIATQAALTGHMVLSTLHTNNAVQAIIRLVDLGVEAYMVAPSIVGVLAQRLARRICDNCRQSYAVDHETLQRYFNNIPQDTTVIFSRGKGCKACRMTGYHGRVALHELVVVDDHMRGLIACNAPQAEINAHARRIGCRSLRYDALKKVLLGLTTIDEVDQLTVVEWELAPDAAL